MTMANAAFHAAKLADEETVLAALAPSLGRAALARVDREALELAAQIRALMPKRLGVETFLAEYGLSSEEGVALMCLAEALLRIPDTATIDALIGDKLGGADWDRHLGHSDSLMINASAWGLALTGRLVVWSQASAPVDLLRRAVGRVGQPVIRRAIEAAMRLMGQQFVMGETIDAAIARTRKTPRFSHSFDMLGEAAATEAEAARYFESYTRAIAAIAKAAEGRDPTRNHGISVKLSALHPRYEEAQRARVLAELTPRVATLARQAREAGLNFTIDAEEADRLVLSLDLFEKLARDPALAGWDGFGLAVQAYQKRAGAVVDWLVALAGETRRRFMVRLVKGAYWDSEIKWAQEKGLPDYPVFTRKPATDLHYRAVAARMLASDRIYGQFATHSPRTALEVLELAGTKPFEFQKLHGMGDVLYELLGEKLGDRLRVRVYAPVGEHRDLLPYLVRRLLENGANTSFVHQIADADQPLEHTVADPGSLLALPAPPVRKPPALFVDRRNSAGLDLAARPVLDEIAARVAADRGHREPTVDDDSAAAVAATIARAQAGFAAWSTKPAEGRARLLEACADAFEAHRLDLMSVVIREGGRTIPDALSELREAVDFLRYYAQRARADFAGIPLPGPTGERNTLQLSGRGVFACISPWNFPLAIFTGQIAAALAAGNTVVAKPAEQTPLVARRAVALMHEAGMPRDALALAIGPGESVGAALVSHPAIAGIAFTGSTATAKLIQRALAKNDGPIVPLIAETGGVNAMIADSSALADQVVRDVVISAFQSAGQRCSALRVLFIQDDVADATLEKLAGAMAELRLGDPGDPATDVGPVIDAAAKRELDAYVASAKFPVIARAQAPASGNFVAPIAFAAPLDQVPRREIFGPILHVARWRRSELGRVLDLVRATGYGLTLGIHSRLESFQNQVAALPVGNVYVNRSMIGAVVGVQPFGGQGLSGTGPKAGGPFYLHRFARETTLSINTAAIGGDTALMAQSV